MSLQPLPVVWHPSYEVDIGVHVFPTRKYRLIRNRLIGEGTITEAQIEQPAAATTLDLRLVHTPDYVDRIVSGTFSAADTARLELPFTDELRSASLFCAGGSILTARRALESGIALHLGGGYHHAFADHGEGFCMINDVAIAIRVLLLEGRIGRAAVIDLDVHHGNGTADVFANEPRVFTFSMHQERNYPFLKPRSTVDVGLEDGTGDDEYLLALEQHFPAILAHKPELAFYLAGADPYEWDQLGGLRLTQDGLRRRDVLVLERCRTAGVPVAVVLAGGYAVNTDDTVEIHCNTVRTARDVLDRRIGG